MRFEKVYFAPLPLSLGHCGCIYDSKNMKFNCHMNYWLNFNVNQAHLKYHWPISRKGIYYNSVKLLLVLSILSAGIILAQNDYVLLKWTNGPYPFQIHANFQILMGHLKFLWALSKIWWAKESLISTLEHNWHDIWIACIWGPAKNKVHFCRTLKFFSLKGSAHPRIIPLICNSHTSYI